jgi:hypothetical protein
VIAEFGSLEITYGFSSRALSRLIPGRIAPSRDQHASHELKLDGTPICPRLGQAVDFQIDGVGSKRVAAWIADRLPFDRIYFYGDHRPLHVSIGPDEKKAVVAMLPGPSGRRVPTVRPIEWLTQLCPVRGDQASDGVTNAQVGAITGIKESRNTSEPPVY